MTNCSECGTELGEGAGVCEKCGTSADGGPRNGGRSAKKVARKAPTIMTRSVPLIVYLSGGLALIGLLTLILPLVQPFDDATVNAAYIVSGIGLIAVAVGLFVIDRVRRRRR